MLFVKTVDSEFDPTVRILSQEEDQKRDFERLTFSTPKCIMLIDVQGRVREENSLHKEKNYWEL